MLYLHKLSIMNNHALINNIQINFSTIGQKFNKYKTNLIYGVWKLANLHKRTLKKATKTIIGDSATGHYFIRHHHLSTFKHA